MSAAKRSRAGPRVYGVTKEVVPGPGKVLFQAANANLNPWTEDKVDTKNPERGPMLIVAAEKDHTVPYAIANASFKREKHNEGVTEVFEFEGRGHSLHRSRLEFGEQWASRKSTSVAPADPPLCSQSSNQKPDSESTSGRPSWKRFGNASMHPRALGGNAPAL